MAVRKYNTLSSAYATNHAIRRFNNILILVILTSVALITVIPTIYSTSGLCIGFASFLGSHGYETYTRNQFKYGLIRRAKSWVRNHPRIKKRSVSNHCWCPAIDWSHIASPSDRDILVMAIGPAISRKDFVALQWILGASDRDKFGFMEVINGNHAVYYKMTGVNFLDPGILWARTLDYEWKFLALDVQAITNTSASVNAVNLGNTEALKSYKKTVEGAFKVEGSFTAADELAIQREAGIPLFFTGGSTNASDHTVLAALRNVVRQQHEALAHVTTTLVPTLVIGSAMREVNLYAGCEHVIHYFHASETKDYARTICKMLSTISKRVRAGTNKNKASSNNKFTTPKYKIFHSLREIAECLARLENWGDRFFSRMEDVPAVERLVFEDVYEFGPQEYRKVFLQTDAHSACGYGIYPDELLFPDCAPSKHYSYRYDRLSQRASLTYRFGVSNGYDHDYHKWASFIRNPVMQFPEFKLVFEITSRIGPFMTYTITRIPNSVDDPVVRRFELRESRKFVRVLDVRQSVNSLGLLSHKYTFSVLQDEWDSAVNWALSLDPKSLTFPNIVSQVRRIAGGVSLVNKELTKAWELPKSRYADFSLAVLIYAKKIAQESDRCERIANTKAMSAFTILKRSMSMPLSAFETVVNAAIHSTIADNVVEYDQGYVETREYMPRLALQEMAAPPYKLHVSPDGELDSVFCDVCERLRGRLGKQKIRCLHPENAKEHTLVFSEEERNRVLNNLHNVTEDPPQLAALKTRVIDRVPKQDATTTCRIHYIEGGPGTGKSHTIRTLADDDSSCIALPFSKLLSDYKDFEHEGKRRKLRCATTHNALELPACGELFIDEFTAIDWVYVKMYAINTGCSDLFLVGDVKQTRINDPVEGTYVGNELDMSVIPTHRLMVNFRNPGADVSLLNAHEGYEMETTRPTTNSGIQVIERQAYRPSANAVSQMFFSHASAGAYGIDEQTAKSKYTVRSYQGSTVKDAVLFLTDHDAAVMQVHGMNAVALSRHKETLTIVYDEESSVACDWLRKFGLFTADDRIDFLETYKPPVYDFEIDAPAVETTAESQVIKDFYADVEEIIPRANYRRDLLVLSKPQVLVLLFAALRCFGLADSYFSNVAVLTMIGMSLGHSFRSTWTISIYTPLRTISQIFMWVLNHVYFSMPALFFVVRAPKLAVTSIVHMAETKPQPLLGLLYRIYVPPSLRPTADLLYTPFTTLKVGGSMLHQFENVHWLSWLNVIARFVNHFGEIPELPDKAFRSLHKPICWIVLSLIVLRRCRGAVPSFVIYAEATSETLVIGQSWFACCLVPNVKLAVQTQGLPEFYNRTFVVPSDWLVPIQAKVSFTTNYIETAGRFFVKSMFRSFRVHRETDVEGQQCEGRYVTPKDSFLGMNDGVYADQMDHTLGPYNQVGSILIPDNARSGSINVEDVVGPINSRGHPNRISSVRRFARGIGHEFGRSNPFQLAATMVHRYLGRKKATKALDHKGILLARKAVQEFAREHLDLDNNGFDPEELTMVEEESDNAAAMKHYDAQLQGIDNPFYSTVRVHLKDIYKPSPKKTFDESKPGQGISAWSKDAQVTFGASVRYANRLFQRALKAHVVFDNRLTTDQMFARLTAAMAKVPEGAQNGVTDYKMFDAQQDEFTQQIEKEFFHMLGFSERFTTEYYRLRKNYNMQAGPISGKARTEKTSGEPATLLGNSVLGGVVMNYIFRGEGPCAMAIKGDDGFKRQVNLKVDKNRQAELAEYTNMQIVISFDDPAEFCGCIVGKGCLAPNLLRRLNSIQGKSFRDYHAYSLYQVSLRDWLSKITKKGPEVREEVIALNTLAFTPSGQDPAETRPAIEAVLDQLVSLSHINEDQFTKATQEYTASMAIPTADGSISFHGGASSSSDAREYTNKEIYSMARRFAMDELKKGGADGSKSEEEIELRVRKLVGAKETTFQGKVAIELGSMAFN